MLANKVNLSGFLDKLRLVRHTLSMISLKGTPVIRTHRTTLQI